MCISLDMWECDFHFHFSFENKKSPIYYMAVPSIKVLQNENDWILETVHIPRIIGKKQLRFFMKISCQVDINAMMIK